VRRCVRARGPAGGGKRAGAPPEVRAGRGVTSRPTIVAVGPLLTASSAAAQENPAPTRLEPGVAPPTRLEQQAGDAPASVTVISREDVRQSASQTVDDLLRQVPGFSLFRRTSSVVGHPTTHGLSLRGIGPSGTSRALVLLDGGPITDPRGGWEIGRASCRERV